MSETAYWVDRMDREHAALSMMKVELYLGNRLVHTQFLTDGYAMAASSSRGEWALRIVPADAPIAATPSTEET